MKKYIVFCLTSFMLIVSLSFCYADGSGEDHICFSHVDADHDGYANFKEFKKFYGDDLEKFKKMDQDSDGKVTHDEYEEYLYNL